MIKITHELIYKNKRLTDFQETREAVIKGNLKNIPKIKKESKDKDHNIWEY